MKTNEMRERYYLHEIQIDEAIKRLEALGFSNEVLTDFIKSGIAYISIKGEARRLEGNLLTEIRQWESENYAVVYHVIYSRKQNSAMYTFLYVDDVVKSWPEDRRKLKVGRPIVYTYIPDEECAFFEEAIIERHENGLARTK